MLKRYEGRRDPFDFGTYTLPPLTVDLAAMTAVMVQSVATKKPANATESPWASKRRAIADEFVGNSELAFLNAQLVSNLRKREQPAHAAALFQRLWAEEADHLLQALNLRWLVSSVQTFADHGNNATQREVGQALRMLFGMMKLYEFERTFTGIAPDKEFGFGKRIKTRLPLDMQAFSLTSGGLDINIIAPVWQQAQSDPVIAPLVNHLLDTLNAEPGGVFRRLKLMREKRLRQRAKS